MSDITVQLNGHHVDGKRHGIMYQQFLLSQGVAPSGLYADQMEVVPTDPISKSVVIKPGVATFPATSAADFDYIWSLKTAEETIAIPDALAQPYIGTLVRFTNATDPSNPDGTGNVEHVFVKGAEAANPTPPTANQIKTALGLDLNPSLGNYIPLADISVAFPSVSINTAAITDRRPRMWLNDSITAAAYQELSGGFLDANGQYIRVREYVDRDVRFTVLVDEAETVTIHKAFVYVSDEHEDNINYALTQCDTVYLGEGTYAPDSINATARGKSIIGCGTDTTKISDENMVTGSGGGDGTKIAMIRLGEGSYIQGIDLRPGAAGPAKRGLYANTTAQAVGNVAIRGVNISDSRNLEDGLLVSQGVTSTHWNVNGFRILGGGRQDQNAALDANGMNLRSLTNSSFVNFEWDSAGNGCGVYARNVRNLLFQGNLHNNSVGNRCYDLVHNEGGTVENITLVGTADRCRIQQSAADPINRSALLYINQL